ncbi:hypothetical protein [Desulfonatronovibrio hydrogenovorans]|uniref:hypothetical protein n=1 Tax=Desulfonatronovibrio hydrogenovorans TaxID=53245 RepID=UPI00068957F1|nr:hypothetical protein [Desulfonatronovibrio hydrogenovorans]
MKRAPQEQSTLECLESSRFSAPGFLGNDPREIEEIISADARTLASHELDRETLAGKLESIYLEAGRKLGAPVEIAPGISAAYLECRGRIPSPFPGEGTFAKSPVKVTFMDGGFFYITPLSIHLIRRHGFFQGKGSPFRIDPEIVAHILLRTQKARHDHQKNKD